MLVVSAEEALRQALYQGPELLIGFRIYGTKGLIGTSFQRNIFLLEAEKKGASSLRELVQFWKWKRAQLWQTSCVLLDTP